MARYPSLAKYFFLLRVDRWLFPAVILVVLASVLGVGSFLKLWPNTPAGFEPVVRVSLVDLLQASALTRSAVKYEAAGHVPAARAAWRGVIGNTPGRAGPLRRHLRILQRDEVSLSSARETIRYGDWLLRLTQNDPSDVELLAQTLEHGRRYTEILRLLRVQEELSIGPQAMALRALFWLNHHELFIQRWEAVGSELQQNDMMQLYALAVQAIKNNSQQSYEAFLLAQAQTEPSSPEFHSAKRLAIPVHAALGKSAACRIVLDDLKRRRLVTFRDYLPYWKLLAEQGQVNEILQQYFQVGEPVTEFEGYSLVRLLHEAGHVDESLKVSRKMVEHFSDSLSLWLDHGNLLMKYKRWHELKSLAMKVNQSHHLSHLWSTAKYWEGLSELFLDENEMAEECFTEIADYPINSPAISLDVVNRLRGLGQKAAAQKLLLQMEEVLGNDSRYWILRCQLAVANKDLMALTESATKGYELDPGTIENRNNYAVALLLQRKDSAKALELGRELVATEPDSVIYKLTLIHALIQNDLLDEAQTLLESLEGVNVPTANLVADYRLALFELAYARKRFADALSFRNELDLRFFIPELVTWIESAVEESKRNK